MSACTHDSQSFVNEGANTGQGKVCARWCDECGALALFNRDTGAWGHWYAPASREQAEAALAAARAELEDEREECHRRGMDLASARAEGYEVVRAELADLAAARAEVERLKVHERGCLALTPEDDDWNTATRQGRGLAEMPCTCAALREQADAATRLADAYLVAQSWRTRETAFLTDDEWSEMHVALSTEKAAEDAYRAARARSGT